MFYIVTHPDVEEKLCEEIQTVLGEKNVGGESMESLRHVYIQPREGGTLIFSSYVASGPASTVHLKKILGISSTPKKIFVILATQKISPIMYLDLKKSP